MLGYKLDSHLKEICSSSEYVNLYSTWTLNKRSCSNALKNVIVSYPHFSMHDSSHADTVIAKIEMLLGERVNKLSPTDTWLLLQAAYAHDLGMILKWEEIEKVWETPDFNRYLKSIENTHDEELKKAAKYIKKFKKEDSDDLLWPLKISRYVNLINSNYFRGKHASMSRKYIDFLNSGLKIDLGHNNLIQPRLIKLLGRICELHTSKTDEILSLDFQTDGFGSDYAHPRFVAMLLRLGDLLDIDNNRFNETSELVIGHLPKSSITHKEKHNATKHILVTPKEIQFSSDCPNSESYLEARNFVAWLEEEVDFCTKYWSQIAPEDIGGYAPEFNKKELFINGTPDADGVAGLKFEISQDKAFQIIEGSNIYSDKFVFIREVLQNAMDATKIQFWRDLVSGTYDAWLGDKNLEELQPFDIDQKIYDNYRINVRISTLPDNKTKVEVSDRGTGISIDSFKRICNVGNSNSGSEEVQKEIESMPSWLRPTAGFGIGLQSIFLVSDSFEIKTSTGNEEYHAEVCSHRNGGYLQLFRQNKFLRRGTTISVVFDTPEKYSFALWGVTDDYFLKYYDPFGSINRAGEVRTFEALQNSNLKSFFPIHIDLEGISSFDPNKEMSCQTNINKCAFNERKQCGKYQILNEFIGGFEIWDREKFVYGKFSFIAFKRSTLVKFKGVDIKKNNLYLKVENVDTMIDVYGLDTKENITLDRTSLTNVGRENVRIMLDDMFDFFCDYIIEQLNDKEKCAALLKSKEFSPYKFWSMCTLKQRNEVPLKVINAIEDKVDVFVNEKDGLVEKSKSVNELIPDKIFANVYFIQNLDKFTVHVPNQMIKKDEILNILNTHDFSENDIIILDRFLSDSVKNYYVKKIRIIQNGKAISLLQITKDEELIEADPETRNKMLLGLSCKIEGMSYDRMRDDVDRAQRYGIPALKEYENLAVNVYNKHYGVAAPTGDFYYIISPFTRDESEKARASKMKKEDFIDSIKNSDSFKNVVQHVLERSMKKETLTEEKVMEDYVRLIGEYYDLDPFYVER